jgi:Clp amino terminal domain, pathogenicity island component
MFKRYSERARRTIFVARYEAAELGAKEIDCEHLLLGLMRESHHLLRYLPGLNNLDQLRNDVMAASTPREINASSDIPFTEGAKRVLAYAAEEAESLGHQHIGTEHLFLGLLREPDSLAAKICSRHGAELTKARQLMMSTDSSGSSPRIQTATVQTHEPTGCVAFVEANSGERVGIAGLHGLDKIPREGEFVVLDDYRGKPRRFRVVEVAYHFHRVPPQAAASAHNLSYITIRVLQIAAHPGTAIDST